MKFVLNSDLESDVIFIVFSNIVDPIITEGLDVGDVLDDSGTTNCCRRISNNLVTRFSDTRIWERKSVAGFYQRYKLACKLVLERGDEHTARF